jgi:hypothetical protein
LKESVCKLLYIYFLPMTTSKPSKRERGMLQRLTLFPQIYRYFLFVHAAKGLPEKL